MGGFFALVGLWLILRHTLHWAREKTSRDRLRKALHGDNWTGKYTRGGELLLRGSRIVLGLLLLIYGFLFLFGVIPR